MSLADIPEALAALRRGEIILVADDEGRENEGDAIMAAEFATPERIAWMVRHTSGYLCAPMTNARADLLNLPPMVAHNEDARNTAYTVSVDAAGRNSTGISATERAHTLNVLAHRSSTADSLVRPGHIIPLRSTDGGVLERGGHTEATVDLMRLAGLEPVGVIGEMVREDGEMMRLPELIELGRRDGLVTTTVDMLKSYLKNGGVGLSSEERLNIQPSSGAETVSLISTANRSVVNFEVETHLPTSNGMFTLRAYRDRESGADHLALIAGNPADEPAGALVRVHSECLTGEAFGSLKCECGPQLNSALAIIAREGGVVIYLRGHEGRGIGLINKLRAYRLQEDGLDTLDANTAQGLPADARDYTAATAILEDLGIGRVRLLTNNPEKVRQLEAHGTEVVERVPHVVGVGEINNGYLETKQNRMGHIFKNIDPERKLNER